MPCTRAFLHVVCTYMRHARGWYMVSFLTGHARVIHVRYTHTFFLRVPCKEVSGADRPRVFASMRVSCAGAGNAAACPAHELSCTWHLHAACAWLIHGLLLHGARVGRSCTWHAHFFGMRMARNYKWPVCVTAPRVANREGACFGLFFTAHFSPGVHKALFFIARNPLPGI